MKSLKSGNTIKKCYSRIVILKACFMLVSVVFVGRLFHIQVRQHRHYEVQAQQQYWNLQEIPARRGDILSRDGYPLATTQISYLLFMEPKKIEDPDGFTLKLTNVLAEFNKFELEDPVEYYTQKISSVFESDLYWAKIQTNLTPEEREKIADLNIVGIGFEEEPLRYYPESSLASHVLGFVASNEVGEPQGYFGIEGYLNGDLKGRPGRIIEEQDATGDPILLGGYRRVEPINGRDIHLTIDRAVQYVVEQKLKEGVEQFDAVSGSVIVMDPFTGEIIAMANYPTYDPQNFNDLDDQDIEELRRKKIERRNLAISQTYEPGSVIKPLTVAAAIDLGLVSPSTTFEDNGKVQYSDYVIDNWNGQHHGTQTIVQLLQKSNNIGAAWVGTKVGAERLSQYFRLFGYGSLSGIDLEGEDTGIIHPYQQWTAIDLATASFGQGISATPLQVLNSFNVLANGGHLMQPKVIAKINDDGKMLEIPSKSLGKVITSDTSETMIYLLTEAVADGESKYFNLKSYDVAGKTGTAQIPKDGRYDPNATNATFVGFLPNSLDFTMIVKLEQPSSSIYAAETAVPLWMDITRELVKYYGVAPDRYIVEEVLGSNNFNTAEPEENSLDIKDEDQNTNVSEVDDVGAVNDTTETEDLN